MAIGEDLMFLQRARDAGRVRGACLEVGSYQVGTHQATCRSLVVEWGLPYTGADIAEGPGVDVVADFTNPAGVIGALGDRQWDTLIMFNVIEHVFDPIQLLDTVTALLAPGGALLIASPAVWELHRFPRDYWRPNPDFYEDYAARRGLTLVPDLLCFAFGGRLLPVATFEAPDGDRRLPSLANATVAHGAARAWSSRAIHRLFNTLGRSHPYTWTALTCGLTRDDSTVLRPTRRQ